jgi:NTE family protein
MVAGVELTEGPKADLVLEGGGVKGLGLLGAVLALAGHQYRFPRVAGTSAGAIVGALVAACTSTGKDLGTLVQVMQSVDYESFRDKTALDHLGLPGEAAELLLARGIYKGDFLVKWLSTELEKLGVKTFGDLRIPDAEDPSSALPPNKRYRLVVMASDISSGQLVRLPWDCEEHYGIDPDTLRVVDAVRASMSIPFFFQPAELRTGDHRKITLVDGGMLSNFPIECFDRTDATPPRWPTFGVKLSAKPAARQVPQTVDSSAELAVACLKTLLGAHDAYHLADDRTTLRTVFVDTLGVNATDFGISAATQQQLYQNGRVAAETFIGAWPPKGFSATGAWIAPPATP